MIGNNRIFYNLTYPQKAIWMIEQFYPNTNINCLGGCSKILEEIDIPRLQKAFNIFLQKNDGLRLRFFVENNEPLQYIANYEEELGEIIDTTEEEFDTYIKKIPPTPFNIINSKLYTFKIYRFENGRGAFESYFHHLISDAWAIALYTNEVMRIYDALKNNIDILDISYPSYSDFIENEQKYIASKRFSADKEYWENQFNSSLVLSSLKNDSATFSTNFVRKTFNLSHDNFNKINEFTNSIGSSLPAFLFSIYSLYFSRILENNNLIIGNPVLNRSSFAEKQTFGMFISTAPVILNYDENLSFVDRLLNITKQQSTMYRHLRYPYEEIIKHVKALQNTSSKLYDIVFSYQNARHNLNQIDTPFEITWNPSGNQLESLMIHVTDTNGTGIIAINYDYLTDVFSDKEIEVMHERIENIIEQILNTPSILCKDIDIVSKKELFTLLHDFNDTTCEFNSNTTIIDEFEKGVLEHPSTLALTFENTHYTYAELNSLANQLAKKLIEQNVQPNDIVGILLPRSAEIIISILAILKIGATYMPIEPEYPADRVAFMVENSSAKLIITTELLKENLTDKNNILLIDSVKFDKSEITDNVNVSRNSNSLAYIMYTSGTTGVPKAVMIRNYSVINFAMSMSKRLDYTSSSDNKVLSVTTMCFDIFVFEVFPTLIYGLHLVIANENQQKNPALLSELIERENICKILTTPSRIQLLFLDSKYLNCLNILKELILGGEPFPLNFIEKLPSLTKARILNLYGPTETTVYSTYKELTNENKITIGKPIENTTIYILDKNKKLLPIGSVGELYIGGSGVAKGYYKNLELTNEKFIKNPYNENEIIYNTGDLGKWLENGELICLGRTDNQIKIRGYRIELGDIESNILKFPGIDKVIVTDKVNSEGKKYLCAYYISEKEISVNDLHKFLVAHLPNYMIPSSYMRLDAFPLTPNHKINKKALPTPEFTFVSEEKYVAPTNETEEILCEVIGKVLNVPRLGINDDIFNYSADSLAIIQIQTLLIPYGWKFKTQDFYTLRTVKEFAKFVNTSSEDTIENNIDISSLEELNNLIEKHPAEYDMEQKNESGYFLTGVTGYLGIHVLYELLTTTNSNIYCAIREKNGRNTLDRLQHSWNYYYANEKLDISRVHIINCDLTKTSFGLNNTELDLLGKNVTSVINCAANVKYYGDYKNHELINVTAVQNLIDFCIKYNIHLNQVSTMGISGNYLVSQTNSDTIFTENDFYIGQNFEENVYIHSKFDAEKLIYTNKSNGLNYTVFRVGNLTSRLSDGLFQQNKNENAFYNILKFIVLNKIVPKDLMEQSLEFTPVDLCAKYLVLLSKLKNNCYKVFHIFNNNFLPLTDLMSFLEKEHIKVLELPSEEFNKRIVELSQDDTAKNSLKAIVNDLDSKKGLSFMPSVIPDNKITNGYLNAFNLEWPTTTIDYIKKLIQIILGE